MNVNMKKIGITVGAIVIAGSLVGTGIWIGSSINNNEGATKTATPTPSASTSVQPTPTPSATPEIKIEFNLDVLDKSVEDFEEQLEGKDFSYRKQDLINLITVQNKKITTPENLKIIGDTYYTIDFYPAGFDWENSDDISQACNDSMGIAGELISYNYMHSVENRIDYNYCFNPLDRAMYDQIQNEYVEIRKMVEKGGDFGSKERQIFTEWLTRTAIFYSNGNGALTLDNGNNLDGKYSRQNMSAGSELTIEYLGQEIAIWVELMYNTTLYGQFGSIEVELSDELQTIVSKIANSQNPESALIQYLDENRQNLSAEEQFQIRLAITQANPRITKNMISSKCNGVYTIAEIKKQNEDCPAIVVEEETSFTR